LHDQQGNKMANLIIKPTSGGSLVLQDEGGDAALTVGTTGSTTLAGTANNLGTSTAGTLSSGVTFPAGHVLQVLNDVDSTTQSLATTTFTDTDLSIAITPSATSSKILCIWTMMANLSQSRGFGSRLHSSEDGALFSTGTHYHVYYGGVANSRISHTQIHIDSPSSTSSITYKVQASSHDSHTISLNDANNQSHLLVMEIAG
jgi:hypothetical protein